ncbi:hypothetical protein GTO10_06850 [Candidatus Saccharibacteria bacterium]|nr:hypothetical protein [Candidatus Saccharibacteria bacterium]
MFEKQQKKMMEELLSDPKRLQKEFENIIVEAKVGDVKIVRRGEEIESITVSGEEMEDIKKALNKADRDFKKKVNKRLRKMFLSGIKIPGLR